MREKTKRLVTYGRAGSHKPQTPKNFVQTASMSHVTPRESEGSKANPRSSPLTKSLQSSENGCQHRRDVDLRNRVPIDHISDKHIPDSERYREEVYDVTYKKRRKLFSGRLQQSQKTDGHIAPISMRGSCASSSKPTDLDHNEVPHTANARGQNDRRSLPRKAHTEIGSPGPSSTPMTYMLRPPPDSEFSNAGSPSISSPSDVDATRHHKQSQITRKRLVDSLGATEESAKTRPLDYLSDGECQSDGCPLSSSTLERKRPQPTADLRQPKISGTEDTQQSATPRPSRSGTSRVTYARQRSFIDDTYALDEVSHSNAPVSLKCRGSRQPYLNTELSSQTYSHVKDEESIDNRPVRSIHELRQAGDNTRFRETVDLIFEDIVDPYNSVSEACNGFVKLCTKLMEPRFSRRFSEYGFDERLLSCMTSSFDIVSITLALCAFRLICVSNSFSSALLVSFWSKVLELSPTLLIVEDDVLLTAKQQSLGLSKAVQASLREILPRLSSEIYGEQPILAITPRLLILSNIQFLLAEFQEKGTSVDIPAPLLSQIVGLLAPEALGNVDFPLPWQRFKVLVLVLSVLETYTILSVPLDPDHCNSVRPLTQIHKFLYPNQSDQSRRILVLYIRVLLNLTNRDPLLCEECCRPELVGGLVRNILSEFSAVSEASVTKEDSSLNTVILALGALINLAERSESSRTIFLQLTSDSASFLHLLLQQFSNSIGFVAQARSVPEVQHNVAIGYLSILLATLCLNIEALAEVRASLDGAGLALVLSTAEEFLEYHQKVEKDLHFFETRAEDGTDLTSRLNHIVCQIRRHEERQ
ncbi:hypothetical protein BBP40_012674 [Aspergillus hancockii]|nr:hypothetical protein BBP40_012674 [Aspergillus hancockii]